MENPKILAINPGSTSTKFAVFLGENQIFKETIRHEDKDLIHFPTVVSQLDYRLKLLIESLHYHNINLEELDAVVGRGGFLHPLKSGTYIVNKEMLDDLKTARYGEHASNLGALMAYELAKEQDIPAYIVDPIVVDEMEDVARLSGIPELERKSHVHALNIKAVSRKIAKRIGKDFQSLNFVVAHLGGGISIVAQRKGQIIDVNNANNEGPFSPERSGGLPAFQLVRLCYSGKFSEKEMLTRLTKKGGFYAYLGTKNAMEVEERATKGDKKAKLVLDGMIYQVSKEIGAMSAVLEGDVDGIILTGGLSFSDYIVQEITRKVKYIAPVFVVPGEAELESLALGALRILTNQEEARIYSVEINAY
ncbi:butyrate kinase [Vulcanibacillus modesticaldus]|uniref:Probable butyrate kinase n=1 Tax=Vulcanibacillus modesticaldus TaxID=337097 RepID=A0A1D2YT11_9BACI|nr:butyrate kinase [Vulcanibacillus modesticaldus]OEF98844.1 butyrate kinase [Vulcanibacillus modesticaldus]